MKVPCVVPPESNVYISSIPLVDKATVKVILCFNDFPTSRIAGSPIGAYAIYITIDEENYHMFFYIISSIQILLHRQKQLKFSHCQML